MIKIIIILLIIIIIIIEIIIKIIIIIKTIIIMVIREDYLETNDLKEAIECNGLFLKTVIVCMKVNNAMQM